MRFRIERSNANAVLTDVDAQVESSYQSIVGEVDILFEAAGPKHLEAQRIGVRCSMKRMRISEGRRAATV